MIKQKCILRLAEGCIPVKWCIWKDCWMVIPHLKVCFCKGQERIVSAYPVAPRDLRHTKPRRQWMYPPLDGDLNWYSTWTGFQGWGDQTSSPLYYCPQPAQIQPKGHFRRWLSPNNCRVVGANTMGPIGVNPNYWQSCSYGYFSYWYTGYLGRIWQCSPRGSLNSKSCRYK